MASEEADADERRGMAATAETLGPAAGPSGSGLLQRGATAVGLVVVVASAVFGGNVLGVRERLLGSETPKARPAAVARASDTESGAPATTLPPQATVLRSQPWWQSVGQLEGTGAAASPVTIDGGAIQWRVKATCASGRMVVRAPGRAQPLVDSDCQGAPTGYGTQRGDVSLSVVADGPWRLQVDQQIDVPLNEPPLAAMTAPGAVAVANGSLYRVDQVGTGNVTLYRLADRSYALRLDSFFVTANSDLEIQLSPLEAPHSTEQVSTARSGTVAALDVTAGSLNFPIPASLDPTRYQSLVIWCERTRNAYAAATLSPP